jgi:S-adenosylmethionine hydrolase
MRKKSPSTIALLTDFGHKDWFVASLKASIRNVHPEAIIDDITHSVPPGKIWDASYILSICIKDFPDDTIFVAVVDPGTGSERKSLLVKIGSSTVIAPDNGLISHAMASYPDHCGPAFEILPEHSPVDSISSTFQGRDILAPVAGKIAAGSLRVDDLGTIIEAPVLLTIDKPTIKKGVVYGSVQYIDHFGNAITNISQAELGLFTMKPTAFLEIGKTRIALRNTFADVGKGDPLTYVGSEGFLEIAANQDRAVDTLGIRIHDHVRFYPTDMPVIKSIPTKRP